MGKFTLQPTEKKSYTRLEDAPQQYKAMYERHLQGETYVSIAKSYGVTPTTVRSHCIHLARLAAEPPPKIDLPITEASPIEALELNPRCYNALRRVGYDTVGEILAQLNGTGLNIRNFGDKAFAELVAALTDKGLVKKPMHNSEVSHG